MRITTRVWCCRRTGRAEASVDLADDEAAPRRGPPGADRPAGAPAAAAATTATRAGAPQVVVPQGADQPYWAGQVADLGIGAAHHRPTPTVESLSAALKTALGSGTRARATAVAGTFRGDGATVAAKLLLHAVG